MAIHQVKLPPARPRVSPPAPAPSTPSAPAPMVAPVRARVTALPEDGSVVVVTRTEQTWTCELLQTSAAPLQLVVGDRVLVLPGLSPEEPPCVLGRIGGASPRVCIRAGEELELRCGPASITLRKDGKVVTRGMDVAAVASRRNRIKGASVEIN